MGEPMAQRLAILAYHKIGEPPKNGWQTWNYVSVETFRQHQQLLRSLDFVVIDAPTLLRGLAEPATLPPRSAVLTFDDGYQSMLTVAQPCMAEFDNPSILFVPTQYVGGGNDFDTDNEPAEPICSFDELRHLRDLGVAVQSHGVSHQSFAALSMEERLHEIAASKQVLEQELGNTVQLFAFPYGEPGDPPVARRDWRNAGYRAALLYKGGLVDQHEHDPFRLTRIAVGPDTNLRRHLLPEAP